MMLVAATVGASNTNQWIRVSVWFCSRRDGNRARSVQSQSNLINPNQPQSKPIKPNQS
jgi:hypothetical protein